MLVKLEFVRKKDGSLDKYNSSKIKHSILIAADHANFIDSSEINQCTVEADKLICQRYKGKIPSVESIQDVIEEVLIRKGLTDVAKSFIIHREEKIKLIEFKTLHELNTSLKLSVNALKILEKRYLLRNLDGEIIETPEGMFRRVAKAVARAEIAYGKNPILLEEQFFHLMQSLEFLPNSPTLMNAGTPNGQLSACFVLPVEDSLASIFDTLKLTALIEQTGGGVGFSFSRLRPKGDLIHSTKGVSTGPISFISIFDKASEVIKQGGKRRGANMAILSIDHPDILDFINAKEKNDGGLSNFNISVSITEKFMNAVIKNKNYDLIDPVTGKSVKKLKAKMVFDLIVERSLQTGDPGIIFIDEVNKKHTLNGNLEAINPCGEQPLMPNESCTLGSINLSKFVKNGQVDFDNLRDKVRLAVHFLDNVIDVNKFISPEIEKMTKASRKIGLGVMGWADTLILLGIAYDSKKALELAEFVMDFINSEARKKSYELALDRGNFPEFKRSKLAKKYEAMRNATVTTIAPTGTISVIAGVSSGIEPLFAVSFVRNVLETKLFETNYLFETIAHLRGFYSPELMINISKTGSVQLHEVPKDIKALFLISHEIDPTIHVKMQAAFQKYTDNAVSKTVNLPENSTTKEVYNLFLLAYKLKCKGIAVYRYGSKNKQVLYLGEDMERKRPVIADSEYSGGCPKYYCGN